MKPILLMLCLLPAMASEGAAVRWAAVPGDLPEGVTATLSGSGGLRVTDTRGQQTITLAELEIDRVHKTFVYQTQVSVTGEKPVTGVLETLWTMADGQTYFSREEIGSPMQGAVLRLPMTGGRKPIHVQGFKLVLKTGEPMTVSLAAGRVVLADAAEETLRALAMGASAGDEPNDAIAGPRSVRAVPWFHLLVGLVAVLVLLVLAPLLLIVVLVAMSRRRKRCGAARPGRLQVDSPADSQADTEAELRTMRARDAAVATGPGRDIK